MEKFTKGNWEIVSTNVYPEVGIDGLTLVSLQKNKFINDGVSYEESLFNAHLIAAAPEIYSMLKNIEKMIIKSKNEIELADDVVSISHDLNLLLAKARGE